MKIKTKKDWQNEIAARVAATEALGEQRLADAKAEYESALAAERARTATALDGFRRSQQNGSVIIEALDASREFVDSLSNSVETLADRIEAVKKVNGRQRDMIGALATSLSALNYCGADPQLRLVLDSLNGFVNLVREGNELVAAEVDLAKRCYDDGLSELESINARAEEIDFPSLADDEAEPVTVEIDLSDLASRCVGETFEERAFFGE